MAGVMVRNVRRLLTLLDVHYYQGASRHFSISIPSPEVFHAQMTMSDPQPPAADPGLYRPPPAVRGMTVLDREAFTQTINVPAIRIPTSVLNKAVKSLKKVALQRPGLKRVVDNDQKQTDSDGKEHRLLLLDPQSVSSAENFGEEEASALKAFGVKPEIQRYELKLTYDNLKSEEVLRAVLPEGQDVTSGFSRVGHIAHMNLRDHQLPYKNLIGQVIIDKNPGVTCVVNKTNTIDSTYRNFQMEVLAGESNMVAKVRENGVFYEFDFSRVYWNPRLSTEHERIVSLLRRGDVVLDVFAGVGPFSIPAARRGCTVFANDLNPESYRWLQHNTKLNKVEAKVTTSNLDGREFIRGPLRERLPELMKGSAGIHIIMNLPALALEFLDAFRGLLGPEPDQGASCTVTLPQVHCYGFSKEDDPQRDVLDRAEAALGVSLQERCSVHMVRNVAPNKEMMCVSFNVPSEVLYSSSGEGEGCSEPSPKRQKREETEG
ncbi:tRNA (guanine(37)-N1)-methyltransferase [Pygocentrus nattereri]|uniref:tRNA (guanine(37)-N1)-methyltransferase n=1 Tax=Pygocentrus nattereri TaxID=42514 RepID=A0A3B4CY92_PYGNA|nr:tRNA (guanine(37)-N1)-methyltransferase [Pygocentrus nattereri]